MSTASDIVFSGACVVTLQLSTIINGRTVSKLHQFPFAFHGTGTAEVGQVGANLAAIGADIAAKVGAWEHRASLPQQSA